MATPLLPPALPPPTPDTEAFEDEDDDDDDDDDAEAPPEEDVFLDVGELCRKFVRTGGVSRVAWAEILRSERSNTPIGKKRQRK